MNFNDRTSNTHNCDSFNTLDYNLYTQIFRCDFINVFKVVCWNFGDFQYDQWENCFIYFTTFQLEIIFELDFLFGWSK